LQHIREAFILWLSLLNQTHQRLIPVVILYVIISNMFNPFNVFIDETHICFSPSQDQESTELDYSMLQFPEDNTRTENSENEQREKSGKDTVYSSLKCQISNITEEN